MSARRLMAARLVSVLFHPFVIICVLVGVLTATMDAPANVSANLGLVLGFVLFPVAVLTIKQVRQGRWQNVDASRPEERPALYAVGLAGMFILGLYLLFRGANAFYLRGTAVASGLLVIAAVTTRWVKVSLHVAAAAFTASALLIIGSRVGWIVAAAVPALMWSRLAMGRHTRIEVIFGLVFGAVAGVLMRYP